MLHDPSKQTGTLAHFISWLQTKPPDEKYDFLSCAYCAVGQYIYETGSTLRYNAMCTSLFGSRRTKALIWPEEGPVAMHPWTFGAALERCRALQAAQ